MGRIINRISKNNKVILTTHSSGLVSQFNTRNIQVVTTENNQINIRSKFKKLRHVNELLDILGFDSHPIVDAKYIIMVEGIDDIKTYEAIINLHYPKKYSECKFVKVNSFRNIETGVTCQLISKTKLVDNLFIITDSDGRKLEKVCNQYNETFKEILEKDEINRLLDNRLYLTENAMNLEALSLTIDNFDDENMIDIEKKVDAFIVHNQNIIDNIIYSKGGFKYSYEAKTITKINQSLKRGNLEEKLKIIKKYLLNNALLKKYRNEVYVHKLIHELDKDYHLIHIPELLTKLDSFFKN